MGKGCPKTGHLWPPGAPVWVLWPAGIAGPARGRVPGYYKGPGKGGAHYVTSRKNSGAGWWVLPERIEARK